MAETGGGPGVLVPPLPAVDIQCTGICCERNKAGHRKGMCDLAREQLAVWFKDSDGTWLRGAPLTHKTRLPFPGANQRLDEIMKFHDLSRDQCNGRLNDCKISMKLVTEIRKLDVSDATVRAAVQVDDEAAFLHESIRRLASSILIEWQEGEEMTVLLDAILRIPLLKAFWIKRVGELVELHVTNFPRTRAQMNSKRFQFEETRRRTQSGRLHDEFINAVAGLVHAGGPLSYLRVPGGDEDGCQYLRTFCTHFDDMLDNVWQKSIQGALCPALVIPRDVIAIDGRVLHKVYYVAGWVGSTLMKRARWLDHESGPYAATWTQFVTVNFISQEEARSLGLPTREVERKSRGGLLYAGPRLFNWIKFIEAAYCQNLTIQNLTLRGADVVRDVHNALRGSLHIRTAFNACLLGTGSEICEDVWEMTAAWEDLFDRCLGVYDMMRGKNFAKKVVARMRKNIGGDTASIRQQVQVASNTAKKRATGGVGIPDGMPTEIRGQYDEEAMWVDESEEFLSEVAEIEAAAVEIAKAGDPRAGIQPSDYLPILVVTEEEDGKGS